MLQRLTGKIKKMVYYLIRSLKRPGEVFENSIDGMYRSTIDGRYVMVNDAMVKMLGYKNKKELMKVNTKDLYIHPGERPSHNERDRIFEVFLKRKDGKKIFVEIGSKVMLEKGEPKYYQGIVRDRTEYKKNEEKIKYISFHDALTGVYNRAYFDEELKRIIKTRKLPLTIIVADVDRLKYVNDKFGHEAGDELLRKTADIFRDNFRNEDIIARTGGDEFCIILPSTSRDEALKIIQRVKTECEFESCTELPISVSFGAAEKKKVGEHLKSVIREAERAMYSNKRKARESVMMMFKRS